LRQRPLSSAQQRKPSYASVDLYVGPKAPEGGETNWIETVPDKAWFAYFRFYGPTEGYFNRTYALSDFEETIAAP
jgi:hypothetical protein